MNLKNTLKAIARHGIPDGYYTVGGIDGGEFGGGIDCIDGVWVTYQTERGKKISIQSWYCEEEACAIFFAGVIRSAEWAGVWKSRPIANDIPT